MEVFVPKLCASLFTMTPTYTVSRQHATFRNPVHQVNREILSKNKSRWDAPARLDGALPARLAVSNASRHSNGDGIEDLKEPRDIEWFGEISAGAGGEEAVVLAPGGIGRDHHDRNLAGDRVRAKKSQHFFPRNVRKVQVQQNDVGLVLASEVIAEPALHRRH